MKTIKNFLFDMIMRIERRKREKNAADLQESVALLNSILTGEAIRRKD